MKALGSLVTLTLCAALALGQEPAPVLVESPGVAVQDAPGRLASNQNFPRFIGFVSNPLQSIDPRSLTQVWPIFSSTSVSTSRFLPEGDIQLYGAGLNLAITDRLSIGLNQGGYAVSDFRRHREGFLNLGGFAQYTLIENVPDQFIVTVGTRWGAPTGEAEVFQGHGRGYLSPYLTIGKELGEFHILATTGYQFPIGGGSPEMDIFYANLHLDRRIAGWIYPLVELNWSVPSTEVPAARVFNRGVFSLGNFETTGNILSLAVGVNTVLIQDRLELGAVYTTPLATKRDLDFDGVLVKMVLRF